ncbi:MAG: U32 family peptidase, partial [Sphaerochaetaceae bacterium]|nr:U32 family peptidase [Sphaerochaetaceae bacterium]
MIELALPAGSLQSALVAFENGADAVYLGLQSFSARKGATNFSFEDIGRLKTSLTKNQKFYVTVNTLATDHEMPQVGSMLRRLALYEPDGVIVQDLGIAKMI